MQKIIRVDANMNGGVVMGIDLGDRFSNYAVIGAEGSVAEEGRVATRAESLSSLLKGRVRMRVVIETGTHSPWVSRLIMAEGHEAVVANARKVKLISRSKNKRDRVDARTLARLGLAGRDLLAPVYHRSEQTQQRRAWLLARDTAVRARTELINMCAASSSPSGSACHHARPNRSPNKPSLLCRLCSSRSSRRY